MQDMPQCAWGTASEDNNTACPYTVGEVAVSSLYQRLRARNLCNHRDYQNMGVNGARITASMPLVDGLARDPDRDHPLLVVFSLIGNDVCNGHPGAAHMTTVDSFLEHTTESLAALDAKLPKGSHVLTISLVDGRVLWDGEP